MTPTLISRIQTRIILTLFIGVPLALLAGLFMHMLSSVVLLVPISFFVGLGFDVLNSYLQQKTWDEDWSILLMVLSLLLEVGFVFFLIRLIWNMSMYLFIMHGIIGLVLILIQLSVLSVLFPYRRFYGGKFWGY